MWDEIHFANAIEQKQKHIKKIWCHNVKNITTAKTKVNIIGVLHTHAQLNVAILGSLNN